MRFATDTGGTFTDLIVEDDSGVIHMYKAPTTPTDPVKGVLEALSAAAGDFGLSLAELLRRGDTFIHGTTHALNAIITGNTGRTAFLTTRGHPDILTLREGGRADLFNHSIPFPEPYVSRAMTFEIPERIGAQGTILEPLDEEAVLDLIDRLQRADVEAIAVCLLWSIVNPVHERRIGELLDEHLPRVPYTLSHRLNPIVREYRRASSTCIDASLKPLMTRYLSSLTSRLAEHGFVGRVLMLTSGGGMLDADEVAGAPIHAINSGPSMAPIAGRYFGGLDGSERDVIVADTGGTTYDVSLVRDGRIPVAHDLWIGEPYRGHMTGFSSIDVKSIGAGGGSIAWVDDGGLLRVGPHSAGAVPGPVCYGRGGSQPTVTDASLVLGHLDPNNFLGGSMGLDVAGARAAILEHVAGPLGMEMAPAAGAILEVATENMVGAIAEITIKQGVDPQAAVLIGGGGAAGLNSVWIARRLGCRRLVIPETGPALSAAGALMSDLMAEYSATHFTSSRTFDYAGVNAVIARLRARCEHFIEGPGRTAHSNGIELNVQARYQDQVWDIQLPVKPDPFESESDLGTLVEDFHRLHEEIFAFRDQGSVVEFINWTAVVRCRLRAALGLRLAERSSDMLSATRDAYFPELGFVRTPVHSFARVTDEARIPGPAIVESPYTTVVIPPDASCRRGSGGNLEVFPFGD